jgi:hypothetical protein
MTKRVAIIFSKPSNKKKNFFFKVKLKRKQMMFVDDYIHFDFFKLHDTVAVLQKKAE